MFSPTPAVSPSTLTLLLVRSGQTEYERQGRIQGTLDVPLCEDGRAQAEQTAVELKDAVATIGALYASDCTCAAQTAAILGARLGLKPKQLAKLQNLDQGLWQGLLVSDVRDKQPRVFRKWQEEPGAVCPPEGETLQDAKARIRTAVAKLVKKHKTGAVILVLPDPLATVARGVLSGEEICDLWRPLAAGEPLWHALPATSAP
ncbi:MAG: histidine phosphatase family protein [Pirellulales bacterium]|nr:histidine phosphatase family protein [Pirellulales bacterium]